MASLVLWTWTFCSLACFSSDVLVALHRFPSSHAPVFLGWHLNGVGPLPPPAATTITARRQGPPVDRRARGTWTATLDYVQKTLHLGALLLATQDGRSGYARDERAGLLVLLSARCAATQQRSDPSLNNQTCSLRAKPACCDFASLVHRISQHRSASSKREPRSPSQHFFWYIRPAWHYAPRQAYWNEDGILSDHSSPKCCFAEGPRTSC